ncbi:MAG: dTMP kinase [Microthrixaceae bacterium]
MDSTDSKHSGSGIGAESQSGGVALPEGPPAEHSAGSRRGWFVVFEGTDGSGKSTQAALLAQRTGALLTHQPGATALGEVLRGITLGGSVGEITDRAEALLMAADRAQHVESVIQPVLASGRTVVCDRYLGSSIAYQGHGRGLDPDMIEAISMWATEDLVPDVVVYLSVDVSVAADRIGAPRDRIEAGGAGFHERVRAGFEALAGSGSTWVTVDGSGSIDEVASRVQAAVMARLAQL